MSSMPFSWKLSPRSLSFSSFSAPTSRVSFSLAVSRSGTIRAKGARRATAG